MKQSRSQNNLHTFVICLLLLLSGLSAFAADVYIMQGGTGGMTGTDWANALSALPATLERGDCYWIADGIYSGYTFDDIETGTTYISIKKALPSNHGTSVGWLDTYGDGVAEFTGTLMFRQGYYDVDGQVGSGRSGHGFCVNIISGTNVKHIMSIDGADNVAIRHLEGRGVGEDRLNNSDDIVYIISNAANPSQYWELSYLWLHNTNRTCVFTLCADHFTIQNCVIEKRHTDGTVHGELFSINDSGNAAGGIFRNNIIADCMGTGMLAIKDYVQSGFQVYGNVFYQTGNGTRYNTSNGAICMTASGGTTTDTKIYNNTFVNIYQAGGGLNPAISFLAFSTAGNEAYNNILFNTSGMMGLESRDYNLSNDKSHISGETNGQYWDSGTGLFSDFANNDFRLATSTLGGMTLDATIGIDMQGNTRGADGCWDRGALEFLSSSGSPTPSASPTPFTPSASPTSSASPQTAVITPTSTASHAAIPTAVITSTMTCTESVIPTATSVLPYVDLEGKTVLVFPNPAENEVKFLVHLSETAEIKVLIYNVVGEKVAALRETLPGGQGRIITWNCQTTSSGIYIGKVLINGKEVREIKLAVVH